MFLHSTFTFIFLLQINPAFGQTNLIKTGLSAGGGGVLSSQDRRLLDVTVVKAGQLGGSTGLCLEPYVVLEVDEPSQKHQSRTGSGAQYCWNDTFSM